MSDPVEIPIDGTLDLHAFQPRDYVAVTESYLEACHERGILRVRVIHGKGSGMQRERIRRALLKNPRVLAINTATEAEGGWGATVVRLKP